MNLSCCSWYQRLLWSEMEAKVKLATTGWAAIDLRFGRALALLHP